MPTYDYRCSCGETFDVVKTMSDAARAEHCPACSNVAERVFTKFYFSGAAVQEAEWNPAFGQVVKNKYHRSELAKRHNMIEVGNDYGSGEGAQKHFEKQKQDAWKAGWEKV